MADGDTPDDSLKSFIVSTTKSNQESPKKKKGFALNREAHARAISKSLETRAMKQIMGPTASVKDVALEVANGDGFYPTPGMIKVLQSALSLDAGDKVSGWFAHAQVNRSNWYAWTHTPGFQEWWDASFKKGIQLYTTEWLITGFRRMRQNDKLGYQYWKEVGAKVLGYIEKIGVEKVSTEQEDALTSELLTLMRSVNAHVQGAKQSAVDVQSTPLTEEEISKLNEVRSEHG